MKKTLRSCNSNIDNLNESKVTILPVAIRINDTDIRAGIIKIKIK